MKKTALFVLGSIITVASANAAFQPGVVTERIVTEKYVTNDGNVVTIMQVADMRDNTDVTLVGRIIDNLGNERYLFEDATGRMAVAIDDEDWAGIVVTPSDVIKIYGEVDRNDNGIEIDVATIQKL